VNVGALWAFERAEVETHASGHNAREHRESTALWASWTMDASAYVVRQKIGFLHNASLIRGGGRATLSVTGSLPVEQHGDKNNLPFLSSGSLFNIAQISDA
jgi:hypothetical protein